MDNILHKFEDDIIILDGLLQFSINPTSMSAGYGVYENLPYIKKNLKTTYHLKATEIDEIMDIFKKEIKKILDLREDKYTIEKIRVYIQKELKKDPYKTLFKNSIVDKINNSDDEIKHFIQIYRKAPEKNFPCLCVQYNAIYRKEISHEKLIRAGILKPLYWISSGTSSPREIPLSSPFLEEAIEELLDKFIPKLKRFLRIKLWRPNQPDVKKEMQKLMEENDLDTFQFLESLYEGNHICILLFEKKEKEIKRIPGMIGLYHSPYSRMVYGGISFLLKDEIFKYVMLQKKEKLERDTKRIIKILEFFIQNEELPSKKQMIRDFGLHIDEIETFKTYLYELPPTDFSDNEVIKNKATKAFQEVKYPSLYDLLTTCQYDIKTAREVAKCLKDEGLIEGFTLIPECKELISISSESQDKRRQKTVFRCENCGVEIDANRNSEYCPYCGTEI